MASIIFLISLISHFSNLDCTVYINADQELIIIGQQQLSYRMRNEGGIITYSYFSGEYHKKHNKYFFGQDDSDYTEVLEIEGDDKSSKTKLCLMDKDYTPLVFAPAIFEKSKYLSDREYYSDETGCIYIDADFSIDSVINAEFDVLLLGNSFSQKLIVKKEKQFMVRLVVPPSLGIQNTGQDKRKYLKIQELDEKTVNVYDPITKKWKIFYKEKATEKCHQLIFEVGEGEGVGYRYNNNMEIRRL